MIFECCNECCERLEAVGPPWIIEVWARLCEGRLQHGILAFKYDHDTLKLLENEGFVLTTDYADGIKVKVLGGYYLQNCDMPYFCINPDEHLKKKVTTRRSPPKQ